MKIICPASISLIKKVVLFIVGAFVLSACPPFSSNDTTNDGTGWHVWVKTSPCSGRNDWVAVAKQNPAEGGGGSAWDYGDLIVSPLACGASDNSCTFDAANASAAIVRASDRFFNYCCRDYSVWQNTQSGEMSVVKGMGTAGFGWQFVKGQMCCEEAEELSGKKGLCSGTSLGGNGSGGSGVTGYIGCFKDTSDFDLDGFLVRSSTNTPESCIAICRNKGFAFAAVQYGESCLCGNSYGKYGAADNCNYKCTGDGSKICGGYSANSVYGTGLYVSGSGRRNNGGAINNNSGNIDNSGKSSTDDDTTTSKTPLQTPTTTSNRWTLVSVTSIPETPTQGWKFSSQSTSAHYDVYNGDTHDFQWTAPPQVIDSNGFTITIKTQCKSQSRCYSLIGVKGTGLDSDTPYDQRIANGNGENGADGFGQKSVTFKPIQSSADLEVEIGLSWGAVRIFYKYRRS